MVRTCIKKKLAKDLDVSKKMNEAVIKITELSETRQTEKLRTTQLTQLCAKRVASFPCAMKCRGLIKIGQRLIEMEIKINRKTRFTFATSPGNKAVLLERIKEIKGCIKY